MIQCGYCNLNNNDIYYVSTHSVTTLYSTSFHTEKTVFSKAILKLPVADSPRLWGCL